MLQTHQQYYRPKKTLHKQRLVKYSNISSPPPIKQIRFTSIDDQRKKRPNCEIKDDDDIPLALLAYRKGYRLSMTSSSSTTVDQRVQSLLSTESSSASHTSLIKSTPPSLAIRPKKQHVALERKKNKKNPHLRKNQSNTTTLNTPTTVPPPSKKKKRLSSSILNWFSSIGKLLIQ